MHALSVSCASGAALFGTLPGGCDGDVTLPCTIDFASDTSQCWSTNVELLGSLREDVNSHALQELAKEDHVLGRMSKAVPVESIDLRSVRSA